MRCGLSPLDSACATAFSPRRDLAPDSLVDLCTGEISWDSLGPSSTDNLAGLYYPTASLLKEMPDEACKIVADAASCAEINQRESAWRPRTRCLRLTHPNV